MNKTFKYIHIISLTALVMLCACKKESPDTVTTSIEVPVLTAPTNNALVNISPMSNAVVTFEWDKAKTGNNTLPFYTVEFDNENGNFSNPVYKGIPNKTGTENKLLLTHKQINRIADLSGIEELQTGKLKWRVFANTGVTSVFSQSGVLEVTRPEGTTDIPAELYLTGTATEGGTDLTKALKFKKSADGVFEIYTSLGAGTYTLVDKISGTPLSFVINNKVISTGTSANSPAATRTVYRINLDFNVTNATFTEIVSVGLWYSGYNAIKANLIYDAEGVWKVTGFNNTWKTESWGKDERYKFRMVEKDEQGVSTTKNLGSSNKDNSRPTASSPASYYFLKATDNTQYDYTYKFASESANTEIEFRMHHSGDYTHKVTFK